MIRLKRRRSFSRAPMITIIGASFALFVSCGLLASCGVNVSVKVHTKPNTQSQHIPIIKPDAEVCINSRVLSVS